MNDTSEQLSINQEYDNYRSISSNNEGDAWLSLELLSWQGNTSTAWDADGTDMDVYFQVCIDLDGESDGISPACIGTEVWYDTLTLSNAWNTTFDLIEENTLLNITIECWDNDDLSDEWGNGPDACDMNPDDDEWRLYYEVNWSSISTEDFSGDGSRGNGSQWGNAESTWRVTVTYFGDEDSDGVYDNKDECSNTTLTANVDQWGCYWGDLDYDYDGILNHNDSCPTIPSMTCSDSSGNYSIMNELILSDLTGGYLETATRIKKENDHSNLVTVSYNCNKFEISLLNSSGECKSNEHITGNIASNQQYFAYFEFDGSNPDKIITHWGEWNISGDTAYFESLTVSDDGRFVIYLQGASVYLWENESVPIKILDITPSGDQGSSTNPGNNLKLSPNGKYFSLSFVGYVGNPKPVYVYDIKNRSGGPIAICDSHDFAHRTSNLICANHDDVTIFDLNTGQMITTYKSEIFPTQGIYLSPSDKYVMQYCRQISVGQSTFCDEENVNIQVTNLETGLSHYPVLSDSASHSEHINSGGFIYGDHTLYFGVQYYYEEGNRQSIGSSKDLNRVVVFGQDTDSDGVYDLHDLCPNTSLFIGINTDGCSASQRDTDGDGLVDSLDRCPNTDINIAVDDTGCWWGQLDTDDDGIQNSDDLCPESNSNSCEIPSEWYLSERSIVLRQCTQEQILTCKEDSSLTENYDPQFNVVSEIKFSSDGLLFATILSRDGVIIFDSKSKNQVARINISSAHSLSFSNDGTILAIGGDANISLWSTSNWQQIGLIGEEGGAHINKISFSPDDKFLAYTNTYPYVTRVIDLTDNSGGEGLFCHSRCAIVHNFTSPYNRIYSMDFSPDGSHFAISTQVDILGEFDVGLIVFETTNWGVEFTDTYGQITDPPEGWSQSYDNIRDLQFSTNNEWLITGSMRGDIRVYERSDWSIVGTFEIGMYGLEGIEISPDDSHIISSTTYRSGPPVIVLDLINGNTESYNSPCGYGIGSTGEIWSLAISNDGSEMIMGGVTCLNEDSNILTNSVYVFEGDSDEDGVLESFDICPYTELTDSVNSQGCSANQVDSDEDGIYDSQDLCSDTGSGVQVDQNGCASNQIDSDADGISDASDQCPNTPNDESVGLTGCSGSQVDTDEDGIYDSQDNCPSTPSGTTVDSTGCAPDDVVDLDSDGDSVRDSVDVCPNSTIGIIVDSTGCQTSGDLQKLDDEVNSEDLSNALVGLCGLIFLVGILVALATGFDWLSSSSNDSYDWDYGSYSSVSSHTNPAPQPEPNLELQDVVAELERQRMQSEREMNQLRQQQAQQSSASEIAAMQREMQALQQRVADSEQAKLQLQNEIEQVKIQKDESVNMQDSVVGGDMVASGATKIDRQTNESHSTVGIQDSAFTGDAITSGGQKIESQTNISGIDGDLLEKLLDRERQAAEETARMKEELARLRKEQNE